MESWRLIETEVPNMPSLNLAIDEAILIHKIRKQSIPIVRFWRNNLAVVVGYSQNVWAEVNLDICREEGVQILRRFSGGGTVYHDLGNLNYTIVIENDHCLVDGLDIGDTYRVLSSGIVAGLEKLGVSAVFSPPSDLFINNCKISGMSQSRRKGVILHHGTLLFDADLKRLNRVLNNQTTEFRSMIPSCRKPVTQINDEISSRLSLSNLKGTLIEGLEESFSIHLIPDNLTPEEIEIAEYLNNSKYSRQEWTFRRKHQQEKKQSILHTHLR